MIEVKAPASGWHEVTQEQARQFVRDRLITMQAIPASDREQYINRICSEAQQYRI